MNYLKGVDNGTEEIIDSRKMSNDKKLTFQMKQGKVMEIH